MIALAKGRSPVGIAPRPDEGVVLAFRRPESVYESARFKLQGLAEDAEYSVKNLDAGDTIKASGKELSEKGLQVVLTNQPDSAIIKYERLQQPRQETP